MWVDKKLMASAEDAGPAGDGHQLQYFGGITHHGDALNRNWGGTGYVQWFEGNLTVIRGQYQILIFHKPGKPPKGDGLLEDSVKYGFLLPGFVPLNWRGMCAAVDNMDHVDLHKV